MVIREYRPEDLPVLVALFYDTVHAVCAADYTLAQLDAWAPADMDASAWAASLAAHHTVVAVEGGTIVGFGDMAADGYLDRLFVHKDFQRRGVAKAICDALEGASRAERFTTHASITARPFFEKRGWRILTAQTVERRGVFLTNYRMERRRWPFTGPSGTVCGKTGRFFSRSGGFSAIFPLTFKRDSCKLFDVVKRSGFTEIKGRGFP